MKPTREQDAVVDLLDVILDGGVIVEADVVSSVAEVALIGGSLRATIAGMTTMTEYGVFDDARAERGVAAARRQSQTDTTNPNRSPGPAPVRNDH